MILHESFKKEIIDYIQSLPDSVFAKSYKKERLNIV